MNKIHKHSIEKRTARPSSSLFRVTKPIFGTSVCDPTIFVFPIVDATHRPKQLLFSQTKFPSVKPIPKWIHEKWKPNLPRQDSLFYSNVVLVAFDFVVPSWVFVRMCKPIYHYSSAIKMKKKTRLNWNQDNFWRTEEQETELFQLYLPFRLLQLQLRYADDRGTFWGLFSFESNYLPFEQR